MEISIIDLLQKSFDDQASDLHITVGLPPVFRVNGVLQNFGDVKLNEADTRAMLEEILPALKIEEFEAIGEFDFSYELPDLCRFRVNAYHQQAHVAIAARMIDAKIPAIETLRNAGCTKTLADKPQGLILVTGPTGSGKSTTLAAMIDYINTTTSKHIITLEDPIEYLHSHKKSVINQREIGADTQSFANGLRAALRQDPDVISSWRNA